MSIPIAPFPPPSEHPSIPDSAYELWTLCLTHHLQTPNPTFTSTSLTDPALSTFLSTYLAHSPPPSTPAQQSLKRKVTTLLHRLFTLPSQIALPPPYTTPTFLRSLSTSFPRSRLLRTTFDTPPVWRRYETAVETMLRSVIAGKGAGSEGLEALFRFSRRAAETFLAGDDWVDVCVDSGRVREFRTAVLEGAGSDTGRKGNWSLVTDRVYVLVSAAENPRVGGSAGKEKAFLKSLVEETSFVSALRKVSRETPEEGRIDALLVALERFGRPRVVRRKIVVEGRRDKGKGKMVGLSEEEEIEIMGKVAMIRELFPDLGSGFLRRCLEVFNGDVEQVTSALLEESLPQSLVTADRSEEYIPPDMAPTPTPTPQPTIRHTPAPITRRNKYDNDALDTLSPATLRNVHVGRKNASLTADALLTTDAPSKTSILSALAAISLDDDERDDTYDATDVGGAVDPTNDEDPAPRPAAVVADSNEEPAEKALWEAYRRDGAVFGRDAETRRSAGRRALKGETGMTDEAIEGWKVMLEREPRRLRMLERRYGDVGGSGQTVVLESTRWSAPAEGEEDSGRGDRGRGGRIRGERGGRGGRGGRGRGGGNVAGPSGDKETMQGRAKKEASKGSRANHNRRDQRAKKLARGGAFPPPA
ncbi:uncharacterized protein H6S33_012726 [Morchella sextelata]|uniref:uncharacterized protein n=1 Tax=Morchella sextelata TaxID=1174677 RepID=UPI001D036453|nr:uncharacterized protein H6S33_012726 [Morchella sextelata]KAH0609240.1 hypothetical protein H6S33_012726 [Morchella sextelata]